MFAHLGSFILLVFGCIVSFILVISVWSGLTSLGYYLNDLLPFAGLTVFDIPLSTISIVISFLLAFVSSYLFFCSTQMTDAYTAKLFKITSASCIFLSFFVVAFLFPIFDSVGTV